MSLSSGMSIGLSGMNAAGAMLDASARNIANLNAPGYRRDEVNLTDLPGDSGVAVANVAKSDESGENLSADLVQMKQASFLYKANAEVVRAGDEMLGSLLDVMDTDRERDHG